MVEAQNLISAGSFYRLDGLIPEVLNYKVELPKKSAETHDVFCANLFENPELLAKNLTSASKVTAQVAYGPELFFYEKKITEWLKAGHFLQIWFENPEQFPAAQLFAELFASQISLVFVPNKTFFYQRLFELVHQKDKLSVLARPKISNLDSVLSPQEFYVFVETLKLHCQTGVLYIADIFRGQSEEIKQFYQQADAVRLEKVLLSHQPLYFLLYHFFKILKFLRLSGIGEYFRLLSFMILTPRLSLMGEMMAMKLILLRGIVDLSKSFFERALRYLSWPFFKIWWFSSYQWRKRVLGIE